MRSGLRGLGDLCFGLLCALNIPTSMYGNRHSVKSRIYQAVRASLRFVVAHLSQNSLFW